MILAVTIFDYYDKNIKGDKKLHMLANTLM